MAPRLTAAQKKAIQAVTDPRTYRRATGLNQTAFWTRYGVTQSGGSRYETGRGIPNSTAILMTLHATGIINDEQLAQAKALLDRAGVKSEEA